MIVIDKLFQSEPKEEEKDTHQVYNTSFYYLKYARKVKWRRCKWTHAL